MSVSGARGQFDIDVVGCRNLAEADNGIPDPYCILSVIESSETRTFQTKTIKKTKDPAVSLKVVFEPLKVVDGSFQLFHKNLFGKAQLLGDVSLEMSHFVPFKQNDLSLTLSKRGHINLLMTFYPSNNEASSVIRKLHLENSKFVDTDFPPEKSILGNEEFVQEKNLSETNFMRASEFCRYEKPELFFSGTEPADIRQGMDLGDAYFLAAMATVCCQSKLIRRLFSPIDYYSSFGIYTVNLYLENKWKQIVIDDMLPVALTDSDDQWEPIFTKSIQKNELWVALLHKAYAKVHLGYQNLYNHNSINKAMEHLTGGWAHHVSIKNNSDAFDTMLEYKKFRHLMCCSLVPASKLKLNDPLSKPNNVGIVHDHIYTILDVREVKMNLDCAPVRLIKLKNFWGYSDWSGKFNKNDPRWGDYKLKFTVNQLDEGQFWMNYADFKIQFSELYICRVPPLQYNVSYDGEWDMNSAGGNAKYTDTFEFNNQYKLKLKGSNNVLQVRVYVEVVVENNTEEPISIYMYKGDEATQNNLVCCSSLSSSTRQVIETVLNVPVVNVDTYTIVPCLFHANTMGKYKITMFCDKSAGVIFEPAPRKEKVTSIKGAWFSGVLNGTHKAIMSFSSNPMFLLTTSADSTSTTCTSNKHTISITVRCPNHRVAFFPYVMTLTTFKKWSSNQMKLLEAKDCCLFPANSVFFSNMKLFECELKTTSKYILILSTPDECTEQFTIIIRSNRNMTICPVK
ncbi:calpain-type cysteine protease DEK1 [Acrasis kona]|uniref:Calpain-type cysteine protease DEK1 n=1 Tax=Acrasis kona TaxID=1008807 RepID=A0AAW2YIU2_9EUKA